MKYTYIKPPAENLYKKTWKSVSKSVLFWLPIPIAIILRIPPLLIIPFVVFATAYEINRAMFWQEFARINGWIYNEAKQKTFFGINFPVIISKNEKGLMFREGNSKVINHKIEGEISGRPFRMFNYYFTIGSGKNSTTCHYTVFGFKYNGNFPHFYLNNKHNTWSIRAGEKISLPTEFEKKFQLCAPKEYEVEALEIFTHDVLVKILDSDLSYDVEFVDSELLIFADGRIDNVEQLEKAFDKSLELQDMFIHKLDKFKFEKIGDFKTTL